MAASGHRPRGGRSSFRAAREENGIGTVTCHATYLINLGATDDTVYSRSVEALRKTMLTAQAYGADGVVFHLGSHLGRGLDAALHQVIPAMQIALGEGNKRSRTRLLIENSAGAGNTMGLTIEDIARVIDELGRPRRVGVCLDTCHLWATGVDIRDPGRVDDLVSELDERIGLDRLMCLHVNDAALPLGARRDGTPIPETASSEASSGSSSATPGSRTRPRSPSRPAPAPTGPTSPPWRRSAACTGPASAGMPVLDIGASAPLSEDELTFRYTRSGGPGGQHVNTTATRVELVFDVAGSPALTDAERDLARRRLRNAARLGGTAPHRRPGRAQPGAQPGDRDRPVLRRDARGAASAAAPTPPDPAHPRRARGAARREAPARHPEAAAQTSTRFRRLDGSRPLSSGHDVAAALRG